MDWEQIKAPRGSCSGLRTVLFYSHPIGQVYLCNSTATRNSGNCSLAVLPERLGPTLTLYFSWFHDALSTNGKEACELLREFEQGHPEIRNWESSPHDQATKEKLLIYEILKWRCFSTHTLRLLINLFIKLSKEYNFRTLFYFLPLFLSLNFSHSLLFSLWNKKPFFLFKKIRVCVSSLTQHRLHRTNLNFNFN